ncbi:hypothetical protein NEOLEDRAFT_1079270 [Neolentinus lepideus HHB14362 ss-1]|uniref:DUF6589 domain-containing protein n=1 Tax=Neolentinus lepideus HHB14362 ss-1 TaxID=1314782 RepID=A0A165MUZ9_9AGAM|nr:hypothetical protein NEOLEDRAFT_1079270 [Neolentinus lepideus HHB14362 ss-1]
MLPHAIDLVCQTADQEMASVCKNLRIEIKCITPELLEQWTMEDTIRSAAEEHAPVLFRILCTAMTSRATSERKTPEALGSLVITQLAHHRSQRSLYFQAIFSFLCWANGVSRQTIEILHKMSLSISFNSILDMVEGLADSCVARAQQVTRLPHMFCYDNVQLSTSIHVEQRERAPHKVQLGTFPIIYKPLATSLDAFRLGPIMEHYKNAGELVYKRDVRPTNVQTISVHNQRLNHVLSRLHAHSAFRSWSDDKFPFESLARRPLPPDHKTEQYPLRTVTIEEGTIDGNVKFITDTYQHQLGFTSEQLCDAKTMRRGDINAFTRLESLQAAPGLFHLQMNLIWALLNTHHGTITDDGSLSFFFAVLGRTRLSCEHPDFYTLHHTLMTILDGLIIAAWEIECKCDSLAAFAASDPSKDRLGEVAEKIIKNHLTVPVLPVIPGGQSTSTDMIDSTRRNVQLLCRDLSHVAILDNSISAGDWGCIEDLLGILAATFRGAGSNKYANEILFLIHNLKVVWTPEFA